MFPRPGFVRPIAVPAVSLYPSRKQEKRALRTVGLIAWTARVLARKTRLCVVLNELNQAV
jgi:hypothetical protein